MNKISLSFIYLIFVVFYAPNVALAAEKKTCPMPDERINSKITSYLSSIKKIAVEFKQTDSRGAAAEGMLIIDKPYKFRCNYYKPFPLLIIGNKNYVSVYDYEMEHFARIKTTENIFNFLLLDHVELNNQFQIIAQKELKNIYELVLYHEPTGRTSNITFDKANGHIKNLIIHEDDNVVTLEFSKTRILCKVAKELFIIQNPEIFGKPKRLGKQEIEKLIK